MALHQKVGTAESENFNQQLRAYAQANGKILFDIADIGSHRPDGTPCFDIFDNGFEALCGDYTQDGGHLNGLGSQRMAKAVWVLMARLAGWVP
jgi:lysophospholipase L1-like esterase